LKDLTISIVTLDQTDKIAAGDKTIEVVPLHVLDFEQLWKNRIISLKGSRRYRTKGYRLYQCQQDNFVVATRKK
jgi:hypothetical protein